MIRLKAFTLIEIIIAMIISGIVILIGGYIYSKVQQNFASLKQTLRQEVEIAGLNTLLNKDIGESDYVLLQSVKKLVLGKDSSQVEYIMEDAFIIRKSVQINDTFNIKILNITTVDLLKDPKYLSAIHLTIELRDQHTTLDFQKSYDPYFLINSQN